MPPRKKAPPATPPPAPGSMEAELAALHAVQEKRRGPRVALQRFPDGPNGPAVYEPVVSGVTADNAMAMYKTETDRHVWLYLAAHHGDPVRDDNGRILLPAYRVIVSGLPTHPYGYDTIIEGEAMLANVRLPSDVISYRLHSIRTSRGRVLWRAGTAADTARRMGQSIASLRPTG